jgi:hypothetical protein
LISARIPFWPRAVLLSIAPSLPCSRLRLCQTR